MTIDIRLLQLSVRPTRRDASPNATSASGRNAERPIAWTIASGIANYTYTSNTPLDASTTYLRGARAWRLFRECSSGSTARTAAGKTGWSVADKSGFRAAASTGNFTDLVDAVKIRVKGTITIGSRDSPRRADEETDEVATSAVSLSPGGADQHRRGRDHEIPIPLFDGRHGFG